MQPHPPHPPSQPPSPFRPSWVLRNQLALGRAPRRLSHLERLEEEGVHGILSLCAVEEAPPPEDLNSRFKCRRLVLPDHRSGRAPEPAELERALEHLAELLEGGAVYVHCVAAVERSPLICLAWLMRVRQLPLLDALDYLMQVHPGTGPLPEQLASLRELSSFCADRTNL
jgi:hypothetical protein